MTSRSVDGNGGHGTPFTPGNSGRPPNLDPQAQSQGGWRDIESAPKDGSPVLVASARPQSIRWAVWSGGFWRDGQVEAGGHICGVPTPSHWMPLPPPPATPTDAVAAAERSEQGAPAMSARDDLKPCPFCGGEARCDIGKSGFADAEISCLACGTCGPNFDEGDRVFNGAAAVEHWNTRAPDPTLSQDVERVKPAAWRCHDLITGEISLLQDGDHVGGRAVSGHWRVEPLYGAEAASLLRSQQAQIAALEGERDYAWSEMKNAQAYWRAETAHAEQAEAQIAEAGRLLTILEKHYGYHLGLPDAPSQASLWVDVRAFLSAHKTEEPK